MKKIQSLSGEFAKILHFPIFDEKKEHSLYEFLSKYDIVKKAPISSGIQTFAKFHQRKHKKNLGCFPSLASLNDHARMRINDRVALLACSFSNFPDIALHI